MASDLLHVWFRRLTLAAACLALVVVILGAFTRLSDAGLGCPDWPGCYGHLAWPDEGHEIARANAVFDRPVEVDKAWKEMVHRYFAGSLGLSILGLLVLAVVNRRHARQPVLLPTVLLGLVIFQALLGMWTVTLQLKPLVVMGHLLGGFSTLCVLWWLAVSGRVWMPADSAAGRLLPWAVGALAVLSLQIALGGWTSSNYAALACPDFPQCQASWWPETDFREAFVLWRGVGIDYEYGVLNHPARTAIHLAHRLGAVATTVYLAVMGLVLLRQPSGMARRLGGVLLAALAVQVGLGVSNVVYGLPLPVAVMHNAVAAALLLIVLLVITVLAQARRQIPYEETR